MQEARTQYVRLFGFARGNEFADRLFTYCAVALQFGLFLVVVYQFNLESRAFLHLLILAHLGWSVHYFLPARYRQWFFVLLSFLGIELVFGFQAEKFTASGLLEGAWLIVVGLGLIGICHLPIALAKRVTLLAGAGVALALARVGIIAVPWSVAIWPVLASMFMFRLIVYVYQIQSDSKPATLRETLGYFFMLPNVCFPFFPVVDYHTFRRTYYDRADRAEIYQTGIEWMFRGAIHLLLYRWIYQGFIIDAASVKDSSDVVQYVLGPFLLYLRVSGTFHVITGLMHLFGFNLPATHNLFYIASSFTDCWRRINIYWTNFLINIFYYPTYFRLRGLGNITAVVIGTYLTFVMTWLLHSYQWFWLRGSWLLSLNDFLFWMILATIVVINAVIEIKRGRQRRLANETLPWPRAFMTGLKAIGVFVTITVLWSFWGASSIAEWLSALRHFGTLTPGAIGMLAVVVLAIGGPAVMVARGFVDQPFHFTKSAAKTTATALLLITISFGQVYKPMGPTVRKVMASIKTSELNRVDFANMERGYYENLQDVGGFNSKLWEIYRSRPADWTRLKDTPAMRKTDGLPIHVLVPSASNRQLGATVKTNRWGMRDRDYEQRRPPGTMRLAMLGASFVFGNGVENEENYSALIETRLNESNTGAVHERFEVLNFGVGGHDSLQVLAQFENKVVDFEPQIILFFEHSEQRNLPLFAIAKLLRAGLPMPYAYLDEIVTKAGIDRDNMASYGDDKVLVDMLRPFRDELYQWVYNRIVEICRTRGISPVWVFLPRPEKFEDAGGVPELELRMARDAGFVTLDLVGTFGDGDMSDLWIARWDHHPNAAGHQMIADRLFEVLTGAGAAIHLGLEPAGGNSRPSPDNEEKP